MYRKFNSGVVIVENPKKNEKRVLNKQVVDPAAPRVRYLDQLPAPTQGSINKGWRKDKY